MPRLKQKIFIKGTKMKINKNYKGLKNVGWRYEIDGYIATDESLEIDLDMGLFVSGFIKAGEYIEAGGYVKAGEFIEAGWSIKAGGSIEAGEYHGVIAGLNITCEGSLRFGSRCFAGTCVWREISNDEKTITCGKLEGGTVEYGILKETGINDNVEKKEAILKKIAELKAEADKL